MYYSSALVETFLLLFFTVSAETALQKRRRNRTNSESFNMKSRLQISKTVGGSSMKRNVSTPGFPSRLTSIELTRLDSSTNIHDKDNVGVLDERRLSSFFFEVQVIWIYFWTKND